MASLYDALDVHSKSSLDEIRRAYHRAARQHHPDKRGASAAATVSGDDAETQAATAAEPLTGGADADFLRIQEAYETLRDPARRAQYDAKLARDAIMRKRDGEDVRIADVVSVKDMTKEVLAAEAEDEEDEVIYSLQCRCGDMYEVTEDELLDGVDVVPCNGCSLNIRVVMKEP